ncbi:hypothetical protein K439DRAFT_1640364 [Ramaria rubella]|nr:hypothetical protein K439DRAFT_1640364 [Ramaria rubella]
MALAHATPSSSSFAAPPPDNSHIYQRLPAAAEETVNKYLKACTQKDGKRAFKCLFPGCNKEIQRKDAAQTHIQAKHLGHEKLFICLTCREEFCSKDSAQRHRDSKTNGKIHPCGRCPSLFARKDHRDSHQKACRSNKPSQDPAQRQGPAEAATVYNQQPATWPGYGNTMPYAYHMTDVMGQYNPDQTSLWY